jgi:MarR family transcriptional regulator, transcriptional regulator for hemolysin
MPKSRKTNIYKSLFLSLEKSRKLIKEQFNYNFSRSDINITFDQWLVLVEISESRGTNQKSIAAYLHKEVASISRILDKLQDRNLILKKANPKNQREVNLFLTHEGLELLEKIEGFRSREIISLFSSIHEQELNLIVDVLKRVNTKT